MPQTDFWISLKRQIFQKRRNVSEQYKLYFWPMVCFCLKKTFRIIIKTLKHCLILLFLRLDLYLTFDLWKREGGGRGDGGGGEEGDTRVGQPLPGTPSLSPILLFRMSPLTWFCSLTIPIQDPAFAWVPQTMLHLCSLAESGPERKWLSDPPPSLSWCQKSKAYPVLHPWDFCLKSYRNST